MDALADTIDGELRGRYCAPSEAQFQDEDGEPTIDFLEANDLKRMAEKMIREYPELQPLRQFPLVYLWKRDGGKAGGKLTFGKCQKASGLVRYFSEATWVIWLAANHVNDHCFTRRQVEALLAHELYHAFVDVDEAGKVKPTVIAHDFAGFVKEVERYGAWMADLTACKDAWQQAPLFDDVASKRAMVGAIGRDGIESVTLSTPGAATLI